jgi:hypothetical protein
LLDGEDYARGAGYGSEDEAFDGMHEVLDSVIFEIGTEAKERQLLP